MRSRYLRAALWCPGYSNRDRNNSADELARRTHVCARSVPET